MLKTVEPVKVTSKEWVKVLDGDGFVTLNKASRVLYSYSKDEPTTNFNKSRDVTQLDGFKNTSLWLKAVSEEFLATSNIWKEDAKRVEKAKEESKETKNGNK